MSISIAHPERYDLYDWGAERGPIRDAWQAEEWECLGFASAEVGEEWTFLWGHLKPTYRNHHDHYLAEIADHLRLLRQYRETFWVAPGTAES